MFWHAHVRWRHLRGDRRSVLLSLLLIFLVLVYVFPLRAMAASLSALASGAGGDFGGSLGTLFTGYGAGFATMAALGGTAAWVAPWAYATLPVSIGLFAWCWRRSEPA